MLNRRLLHHNPTTCLRKAISRFPRDPQPPNLESHPKRCPAANSGFKTSNGPRSAIQIPRSPTELPVLIPKELARNALRMRQRPPDLRNPRFFSLILGIRLRRRVRRNCVVSHSFPRCATAYRRSLAANGTGGRAIGSASHSASTIVTLAMPPPSHIVCSP